MGELGVLFNPGMRHEQEEKLAKQMLREDEGTGRKGRLGIDLESGVVVIGAGPAHSGQQAAGQPSHARAAGEPATAEAQPTDTGATEAADIAPVARRSGSRNVASDAARREPAAAPSGKARRRSQPSAASHVPTGKARRGGR